MSITKALFQISQILLEAMVFASDAGPLRLLAMLRELVNIPARS